MPLAARFTQRGQSPAVRRPAAVTAFWAVLVFVSVLVGVGGLRLRTWAWSATDDVRFTPDIDNAYRQGTRTLNVGYLDRYDDEYARAGREYEEMGLDYGPARLLIATVWSGWVHRHAESAAQQPAPSSLLHAPGDGRTYAEQRYFYEWASRLRGVARGDPPPQDQLCRPLLLLNLVGEAATAAGLFLLVRRFSSGGGAMGSGGVLHAGPRRARGAVLGLVAASLLWLDPALVSNAHCWPQWDSWVLPFFAWAVLCAVADAWVVAGALVAVGAMFKGQSLFAAPLFLLWPIFQGRVGAAVRWVVGAAAGVAGSTGVWLVRTPGHLAGWQFVPGQTNDAAVAWVVTAFAGIALLIATVRVRWHWIARATMAWAVLLLVGWPLLDATIRADMAVRAGSDGTLAGVSVGLIAGLAVAAGVVSRVRWQGCVTLCLGWAAGITLLCVPVFGGSTAWFATGVAHGTTARQMMSGTENDNLANLLALRWGWDLMDPAVTIPPGPVARRVAAVLGKVDAHAAVDPTAVGRPVELPLKYLLATVWFVATAACAGGAAMHHRRGNVRFLIAVAAPWVLLFAVMGQMHQRYLLWGACLTAAAAAVSPGLLVLHLALAAASLSQEMRTMFQYDRTGERMTSPWWRVIVGSQPGFGWAVLAIAAVYLYVAVRPGRRVALQPGSHQAPV